MPNLGLGFFLGGMADNRNKRLALEMQQKDLAFREQQDLHQRASDQIAQWQEVLEKAKSGYQGTSEEFMVEAAPLINAAQTQISQLSRGLGVQMPDVNARLQGVQTKGDELQAEIEGEQKKIEAGVKEDPDSTELTKVLNLLKDARASGDKEAEAAALARIRKMTTVTGRTPEDMAADAVKKEVAGAGSGLRDLRANVQLLEDTRAKFEENPLAGGALGSLLESAAGVAGQIDLVLNTNIEGMLPGDSQKIQDARTQAQITVSALLTTITQEESGRFTDTERGMAKETLAALRSDASPKQIKQALTTALGIMMDSMSRFAEDIARAQKFDLSTDEGVNALDHALEAEGVPQTQREDVLFKMSQRGIIRLK